jgi:hypothetical protein
MRSIWKALTDAPCLSSRVWLRFWPSTLYGRTSSAPRSIEHFSQALTEIEETAERTFNLAHPINWAFPRLVADEISYKRTFCHK